MTEQNRFRLTGLVLFVGFLFYYVITSSLLPSGAGPDEGITIESTKFIYENLRLPVFPDDELEVAFTPSGTTRATRPPLSNITSGLLAHISPWEGTSAVQQWRHGSSVFIALTVLVVYIGLYVHIGSLAYAFCGALMLGMLPQLTFIASYNNDDSAAVFTASLLVLAMIVFRRYSWATSSGVRSK